VIGFAIGAGQSGGSAIHVYVRSSDAAATVGAAARDLLAPAPIEVITMSPPAAQED
jgi:hypothetical protein